MNTNVTWSARYMDDSFQLATKDWRAWFTADGDLKDCEYKRWENGTLHAVAVSQRHTNVRSELARLGKIWASKPDTAHTAKWRTV